MAYIICKNGHYYNEKFVRCNICDNNQAESLLLRACKNGHYYDVKLDKCPYCYSFTHRRYVLCETGHFFDKSKSEVCPICSAPEKIFYNSEYAYSTMNSLPNGTILHEYRLGLNIGYGSTGFVYLAENINLHSQCAIKEFKGTCKTKRDIDGNVIPDDSEFFVYAWGLESFFQEAKLMRSLNHPNIVSVIDMFKANGTGYYVMDYKECYTLERWIKLHQEPDKDTLLQIFIQLIDALSYIHDRNVLHLNITPSNILILQDGTPILIDFWSPWERDKGEATDFSISYTDTVNLSLFYPIDENRGKVRDIFCLASCMYAALTKEYYDNSSKQNIFAYSNNCIHKYGKNVIAAIGKAISSNPDERFLSAEEFKMALLE
jgi:serine/threonine protein kinase